MDELQQRFPERVQVSVAGYSYEKRPLKIIKISNGVAIQNANRKVILIDAGIHARDWISVSTALYIIYELVENFENYQDLFENYEWIIMPVVNADGYEFTFLDPANRMWKKTRRPFGRCFGVDLDRNFDFMFGFRSDGSNNHCTDNFEGPFPFSETESIALRDVIDTFAEDMALYITLRAFGECLLSPWSFDTLENRNEQELLEVAEAFNQALNNYCGKIYHVGNAAIRTYYREVEKEVMILHRAP